MVFCLGADFVLGILQSISHGLFYFFFKASYWVIVIIVPVL